MAIKNKNIPTDEEWLAMTEDEQEKWYDDNGVSGLFRHTYDNAIWPKDEELDEKTLKKVQEYRKKMGLPMHKTNYYQRPEKGDEDNG